MKRTAVNVKTTSEPQSLDYPQINADYADFVLGLRGGSMINTSRRSTRALFYPAVSRA
jgi:hypothetical protein